MRRHRLARMAIVLAAVCGSTLAPAGCRPSPPSPQTPEEFVTGYSAAYRARDADTIMALRYNLELARKAGVREDLAQAVSDYNQAKERDELEKSLAANDAWAMAWSKTTLVEAREHEGHFHVTVNVAGARSGIVLMRDDGMLKVHPRPSFVN